MNPTVQILAGQNAAEVANGYIIREFNITSSWNWLRIGMLYGFTTGSMATMTATPRLVFGICSGSQGYGSDGLGHFFGLRTNDATMPWASSSVMNLMYYTSNTAIPFRASGGQLEATAADAYALTQFHFVADAGSGKGMAPFYLDYVKGTPTPTGSTWLIRPWVTSTSGSTSGRCSMSSFLREIQSTVPAFQTSDSASITLATARTVGVNEAESGSFNAVNIYWNRQAPLSASLVVYAVAVAVMA